MYPELHQEIMRRLPRDFDFKNQSDDFFQQGVCPNCGKRELYTHKRTPWVLRCGRLNKCGHELHVKQLYPDLFNSWSERFPLSNSPTDSLTEHNPNKTADAYLQYGRGFDLTLIKDWYQQGSYYCNKRNIGTATVRFTLTNGTTWERFIDRPDRFGAMKANFKGRYQGYWWQAPNFSVDELLTTKELWLTEGIFDAIALLHIGISAVSVMSCNNFPAQELENLEKQLAGKTKPILIFAFDTGTAGESFTQKYVDKARELGWQATAAQPPKATIKLDWNELLQRDKLTQKHLEEYRYLSQLLIAGTAMEKAQLIYQQQLLPQFPYEFNGCLYWFVIDIESCRKTAERLADEPKANRTSDNIQRQAIQESSKVKLLCKCFPQALYFRKISASKENSYYFKIDFPHQNQCIKATFTGSHLSSGYEFKRRLLSVAPGAVFHGNTAQLDRFIDKQLYNIKQVEAIDFVGYSVDHQCYVFNQVAVKHGRLYPLNEEDYFDIPPLSIKSLQPIHLTINQELDQHDNTWLEKLWISFGAKGMVALTFWFGSLFAEQIRLIQKSYPFLEIVGEPGTGKTTLIEFLWKCVGRSGYEGFDPNKSSLSARTRNMAQVGNLPVVLSEADRGSGKDPKMAKFEWDEIKMAYNGRATSSRGVKNNGNDTLEPPFRGTIVIEQNSDVQASPAILQRIVHIKTDTKAHNNESLVAAEWLENIEMEKVSGFILKSILQEKQVLKTLKEKMPIYVSWLKQCPQIKTNRIAKTHGQLCALADALAEVIAIPAEQLEETKTLLMQLAKEREQATCLDHPYLQTFWDVYEFLESEDEHTVNHARDPKFIAINLNQFLEMAVARKQQLPMLCDLKRLLKSCRLNTFVTQKTVNSAVNDRLNKSHPSMKKPACVKCWVFKKGEKK